VEESAAQQMGVSSEVVLPATCSTAVAEQDPGDEGELREILQMCHGGWRSLGRDFEGV